MHTDIAQLVSVAFIAAAELPAVRREQRRAHDDGNNFTN